MLAKYLEMHCHTVRDKSVLELGAGTGVAGMAVALLGARQTLLTGGETATPSLPPFFFLL